MRVPRGTGPVPARLRCRGRPGPIEVARAIHTRRAVDGAIQIRYDTDLTVEDYVTQKAWWDASPPACPYHPQGGCRLAPHGSYGRKQPDGVRVRRFLCRRSGRTVSLLPDCLAAHWSGTLAEVEQVVREAARAASLEEAANRLRTDRVSLASALRWVRRRVQAVQALLTVLRTLYPERFGELEPRLEDFSGALGSQAVLPCLRALAEQRLGALPAPAGFFRRWNRAGLAAPARLQHANGLDPPPAAA